MSALLAKLKRDRDRAKLYKGRTPAKKKATNGSNGDAAPAPSRAPAKAKPRGKLRESYEHGKAEATRRLRRLGGEITGGADAKLVRASKKIAAEHWAARDSLGLAEITRYLIAHGGETPANVRRLKSLRAELRASTPAAWKTRAQDQRLGEISTELRALTEARQPRFVYEQLWMHPYTLHAPEAVRLGRVREDEWFEQLGG